MEPDNTEIIVWQGSELCFFHSIVSQFKKIDYRCHCLYLTVVLKMSKGIYNIQNVYSVTLEKGYENNVTVFSL